MPEATFIPGVMGSELFFDWQGTRRKLWDDVPFLTNGLLRKMRLDDGGTLPGTGGQKMYVGEWFVDAYKNPFVELNRQLEESGWWMTHWTYDWRKDFISTAQELFSHLRDNYHDGRPATLVCHSAGGIVARLAYSLLKKAGKQANVRRIITLGTPHKGTYSPLVGWGGLNKDFDLLVRKSRSLFGPNVEYTYEEIAGITASWPAMYELLPRLTETDLALDPSRESLYHAVNYNLDCKVDQDWLDHAKNVFQPRLADPDSIPPGDSLVTVAGLGIPTAYASPVVHGLSRDGSTLEATYWKPDLSEDDRGDGTVTLYSALVAGSKQFKVRCDHAGLFQAGAYSGWLADLITEEHDVDFESSGFGIDIPNTTTPLSAPRIIMSGGEFTNTIPMPNRSLNPARNTGLVQPSGSLTGVSVRPR